MSVTAMQKSLERAVTRASLAEARVNREPSRLV